MLRPGVCNFLSVPRLLYFLSLQVCCVPNFRSFAQKLWPGAFGQTYGHTYRGPKQGKPGRNQHSSQSSVLVSKQYRFVKQCWLGYITGLYRVRVREKYRFLPQHFKKINIETSMITYHWTARAVFNTFILTIRNVFLSYPFLFIYLLTVSRISNMRRLRRALSKTKI